MAVITQVFNDNGLEYSDWDDPDTWDMGREPKQDENVLLSPAILGQAVRLTSHAVANNIESTGAQADFGALRMVNSASLNLTGVIIIGGGANRAGIDNNDGSGGERIIFSGSGGSATLMTNNGGINQMIDFTGHMVIRNWDGSFKLSAGCVLGSCDVVDAIMVWTVATATPTFIGRVTGLNSHFEGNISSPDLIILGGTARDLTVTGGLGRAYGTLDEQTNSGLQFTLPRRMREPLSVSRRQAITGVGLEWAP